MRLGVVVGAHGLAGELRVRTEGDDLTSLMHVPTVRLVRDESEENSQEYEIAQVRAGRDGEGRLRLQGVSDREGAEALRGASLWARRSDLPKLPPGEFYAFELVGCEVFRVDGSRVGRVREIWATGRDVLVIEDAAGRDQLVPAVEPLLQRVDLAERRIEVDLPPGLLDPEGDGETSGPSGQRE